MEFRFYCCHHTRHIWIGGDGTPHTARTRLHQGQQRRGRRRRASLAQKKQVASIYGIYEYVCLYVCFCVRSHMSRTLSTNQFARALVRTQARIRSTHGLPDVPVAVSNGECVMRSQKLIPFSAYYIYIEYMYVCVRYGQQHSYHMQFLVVAQ